MAKTNAELQTLEEAQSRNEQFLDYLCGRATDINALPIPESRIEEFLEFLCYNGGIGGGGGANPFTGLTNATLNGDIITFDKSDGTTVEVPLTDFIRGELTKVGGTAQYEDKVPQLNADGKIHISMIPDLSFNKIHSANNEIDANELINNGTAQIGDTIIVKDTGSVYLYVNDQVADFNDRTIEIAFADGAVKMVNGEIPNPQGNVTVEAQHIPYDKNTSQLVATDVQGAIDELNDKFIENVTYDEARNRTIFKTKGGQQEAVVEGLVTRWKHLDYVEQYPYINVFDLAKRQQGKQYGNNGQVVTANQYWHIVEVDVEEDTEYTLMKMHSYSNGYKVVFFNSDGTYHSEDNNNAPASNGWHRKTVRTPQGVTKVGLQLQYGATTVPRANEMMFLKGNVTENINPFIPYADGNLIQVLKDISLEFDNSNSNLKSTTVESAIKEVNSRFTTTVKSVNNQLPNELGNVTVNASQINTLNGSSIENELSELSIRKADKYKPTFMTDLTVDDIKLANRPIKQTVSIAGEGLAGTKTLAGNTDTSIPQGTKVSLVKVGVHGYTEGETVTGVEVYAVDKANNTIVERIVYDGIGVARFPKGYENYGVLYVDVEVNKSFSVEVYFIARLKINNGKGLKLYGTLPTGIAFDKATDDAELAVGTAINNVSSRVPNILIYGETSLSNAIVNATLNNTNGIDFTKANGNKITIPIPNAGGGTVTSVNGVNPNSQGNVTVGITDITGLQGQLDGKVSISEVGNVANKIPVINGNGKLETSLIPDLAITDVFVVADENEMMQKSVQVGDVIVVESLGNKVFMCKDPSQPDKINRFIEINMGIPMVMEVNGVSPNSAGEVTLFGSNITAFDGVTATSVQNHLTNVRTTLTNHSTRISTLENKPQPYNVGDIVPTFKDNGNGYRIDKCQFMYCGTSRLLTRANYPEYADVLGIDASVTAFNTPVIPNEVITFDISRRATKRYYVCIKNS